MAKQMNECVSVLKEDQKTKPKQKTQKQKNKNKQKQIYL